jgi:hypothetical protein
LENRGVDVVRRNIFWAAVRIGGAGGWARDNPRQMAATPKDEAFVTE